MENLSLMATFKAYLNCVKSRDFDNLKNYLTTEDTLPFVDGGGNLKITMTDYLSSQKNWFLDPNWTYRSEIRSIQEFENTGIIIDETTITSTKDGESSDFNMLVTYVFQRKNNTWLMVTDVCTAIL